jgi:chromosome segregation ATPase
MRKDIADRQASDGLATDALSAQDRLQKRIDDLMSLSRQIETQRRHLNQQKDEFESLKSELINQKLADAAASDAGMSSTAAGDKGLTDLDHGSRELERQLSAAERETAELESELKKLDENFNAKLAELNIAIDGASKLPVAEPTAEPPILAETADTETAEVPAEIAVATGTEPLAAAHASRPLRGVANVISLAARIRSQQKNAAD